MLTGKIFNIFNIVKFQNDDCVGDSTGFQPDSTVGTCYTSTGKLLLKIFYHPFLVTL